jgi:cation diffusion facilitator CzcD-associated flavoprotein CzcO
VEKIKPQIKSIKIILNKNLLQFDTIIIGAGISGLYQLHKCRDELNLKTLAVEEGSDIGGTWYWNRYPGARCDSESHTYGYTFSEKIYKNWTWKEKYPKQNTIFKYLKFVEKKLNLRKDILFNNKIISAKYLEKKNLWKIKTSKNKILSSKYLICAVGSLSSTNIPKIKGLNTFKGKYYHTGRWPKKKVNLKDQVVAQIGTGSSGIQVAPEIAKVVKKLVIFQRTPNYSIPARNKKLTKEIINKHLKDYEKVKKLIKKTPGGHTFSFPNRSVFDFSKIERDKIFEKAWHKGGLSFRACFGDITKNLNANKKASNFIKEKILKIVKDKKIAKILTNFDHPFTSKRPTLNTNYYETFNRKNIELIDLKTNPIIKITKRGIKTKNNEFNFDKIIFATGYDALTGPLLSLNLVGNKKIKLKNFWNKSPKTYLGLMIPNFPNLFVIQGPGSPSVLTNVPVQIEQHVEWITNCLKFLIKKNKKTIEPTMDSANKWSNEIKKLADASLFMKAKISWYKGDNIPGKPKVFIPYPGGLPRYRNICNKVEKNKYKEFLIK